MSIAHCTSTVLLQTQPPTPPTKASWHLQSWHCDLSVWGGGGGFNDAGRATANRFPILTGTRPEVRPAVPLLVLDVLLGFKHDTKTSTKRNALASNQGMEEAKPLLFYASLRERAAT